MLAAMTPTPVSLPDNIATLKAMVAARDQVIEALKLTISKLRHASHGASSERGRKLLDQLELQLAELQESAAQDKTAAELAAPPAKEAGGAETARVIKPARRPPPEHLPRERVMHPDHSKSVRSKRATANSLLGVSTTVRRICESA